MGNCRTVPSSFVSCGSVWWLREFPFNQSSSRAERRGNSFHFCYRQVIFAWNWILFWKRKVKSLLKTKPKTKLLLPECLKKANIFLFKNSVQLDESSLFKYGLSNSRRHIAISQANTNVYWEKALSRRQKSCQHGFCM